MTHDSVEVVPATAEHEPNLQFGLGVVLQIDPGLASIEFDKLVGRVEAGGLQLIEQVNHALDDSLVPAGSR